MGGRPLLRFQNSWRDSPPFFARSYSPPKSKRGMSMKALREFFSKVVPARKGDDAPANSKPSANGQPGAAEAKAAGPAAASPMKDRDATADPFEKDGTPPDDIEITPRQATLAIGGKQQFTAIAVYGDGKKRNITKEVV